MKRSMIGLVAVVLTMGAVGMSHASIQGVNLGTGAPPTTLGTFTMTPFGDDTRPVIGDVSFVDSPLGGPVSFGSVVSHREIGNGWATWSHGYTGDVYYTNGATTLELGLPSGTGAFYLYAEPNPFSEHTFVTVETVSGASLTQQIHGSSGAAGFGFYTDSFDTIQTIQVSSDVDFAVGEFGIAAGGSVIPEPATVIIWSLLGTLAVGVACWRRKWKII